MNMNDFQRLTIASVGEAKMSEHLRAGMHALEDHVEEAHAAMTAMKSANDADEYVDQRERIEKMMGFILVDVAEICEGLDVLMDEVAMRNLVMLLQIRQENGGE